MIPTIRDITAADEAAWRALWGEYCRFYRADLPEAVTANTWAMILYPATPVRALVAEAEGEVVGFANYVVHPYTWSTRQACYLEDLFVSEAKRGEGHGRALIQALVDRADAEGWGRIYWMTQEDNAEARRLYDRFTPRDAFVRYLLAIPEAQ
jgi:GNAT superfamily N-acetyltransferase